MSREASEDFLLEMKELVRTGKRHFVRRTRNGKNYIQQLADLGLSDPDEAWEIVLLLDKTHWFDGPDIDHRDGSGSPKVVWIFKMEVNGAIAYIKLKDERTARGCICMSFHEDYN